MLIFTIYGLPIYIFKEELIAQALECSEKDRIPLILLVQNNAFNSHGIRFLNTKTISSYAFGPQKNNNKRPRLVNNSIPFFKKNSCSKHSYFLYHVNNILLLFKKKKKNPLKNIIFSIFLIKY
jgi:hypothetical protein